VIRASIRHLGRLHNGLRQTEQVYMVLVATLIGLLGGLGAVGFRLLIRLLNDAFWREGEYTIDYIYGLPVWWKILVPSVGGIIVGLIVHRFAPEAKGHGVPEVMEAVALRSGRIRPRVVIAKLFASGICIASGGSVGREGPIVQIGSALGSTIGQWIKIDENRLRTLVGCGAAAGIAGTFNAPIAGALFAVEIILGDFGVSQFSPIVISSVAGTVVSQYFLGNFPAFRVPAYHLVNANELFAYAIMGIMAGLVAIAFVRSLYGIEDLFDKIHVHPAIKGLIGGAVIGGIGVFLPHIFGVGYEAINQALTGKLVWSFMLLLLATKILAVSVTIGSGGSGGIFAPSLFIGAMLGGAVGTVMQSIWPLATGGPGAYALVGMGAVVGAATHAPITSILIIFELTNDYKIILPLMISCIIATLLATRLQDLSIYTLKLQRRGIDIRQGRAINVLEHVRVRDQMRTDIARASREDGLATLASKLLDHPGNTLFVVTNDDRLLGLVTAHQLQPVMADAASLGGLIIADDILARDNFPIVAPDDSLANVMKLLGDYRGEVPVVQAGKLVGVLWPEDVIARYNSEIFKRDMANSMVSSMSQAHGATPLPAVQNTLVAEIPVPTNFIGRTIRDLDVRTRFGVSILLIKQKAGDGGGILEGAPTAAYTFRPDDIMLAMGSRDELRDLRRGVPRPKATG